MKTTFARRAARAGAFLVMALVLPAVPAFAQWTGKGEAGLVVTTGNAETTSGNVKLAMQKAAGDWTHKFGLAGVYIANDVDTTAQRWEASAQTNRQINARTFWFGSGRYEDDRFSGFNYQGALTAGLGHKFIDSEETKLSGQIGLGYKLLETRVSVDPVTLAIIPAESDSFAGVFAGADYLHRFNASTSIVDKLVVEAASTNTFIQNDISLQVKMSDRLALAVGYQIRHNTDPPRGFKKTDSQSTVNVVYEIK
jgi:putative salt-induced outer membrane protein